MRIKVIVKRYDGQDEEIAACQFDDAELLFNHYKGLNSYVRVEFRGMFINETVLEYEPIEATK